MWLWATWKPPIQKRSFFTATFVLTDATGSTIWGLTRKMSIKDQRTTKIVWKKLFLESLDFSWNMQKQTKELQLSKSSQAKKWGAYFSAVCGWNSVPISATEAYGHRVCNRLLVFYSPGTFVLPHTCTQHPRGHGRFQKDLFRSRSNGFLIKQIQSTCFWTNPSGNAHVLADAVCKCGAKKKYLEDKKSSSLLQTRCPCASVALIGTEFHPQTAEK